VIEGGIFLVSNVDIFTNLTGALDEVKKESFMWRIFRPSVRPSVTKYQSLNHSSEFHEIPCKLSLKNDVERAFHENRLSDSHTLLTGAINF
jgi:hypothetical protein